MSKLARALKRDKKEVEQMFEAEEAANRNTGDYEHSESSASPEKEEEGPRSMKFENREYVEKRKESDKKAYDDMMKERARKNMFMKKAKEWANGK